MTGHQFKTKKGLKNVLHAKGKGEQAEWIRYTILEGIECIFVYRAERIGLGAVMCAERAVGGDPFAVLLADDLLTDYEPRLPRQQGKEETVHLNGRRFDHSSVEGFMKASNQDYTKRLGI